MVFPERLREGDTVGLAAPAFPVKEEERDGCVKLLEGMGPDQTPAPSRSVPA